MTLLMTACADMPSDEKEGNQQLNDQENIEETEKDTVESTKNRQEHDTNGEEQIKEKQVDRKKTDEMMYKIDEETSSVVPVNEQGNEKIVLLTIDDAPDTYALEMAKTLKEMNAGAIFFVNGHFLNTDKEKKILKKIHSMGFAIGNHTYNHVFLPDLSKAEQKEEIVSLNKLVEKIIGEQPKFFRAPNGANTDYSRQVATNEGMVVMNWSYGYDYFKPYMDAKKLTKAMVTGKGPEVDVPYSLLKSGANLLMHDREWTNKALPDIVKGLRDKGYEMVDPDQIKTTP